MRLHIADTGPRLTPEMLASAEARLGFRLPDAYVAFLRENNGGRPTPHIMPTPEFPSSSETDVDVFFAIDARIASSDLVWNYELWLRDSPPNLLPIASDSGGSTFCLSIAGDDAGRIYYWDWYRKPHSVRTRYPWIYPAADSLEQFLNSFRELTPEEQELLTTDQFVWRTDWMTVEVRRDDQYLDIGQYLHLEQHLPPGETGWTTSKLELPESFSVHNLAVADGSITFETPDGSVFRIDRDNFSEIDVAILAAKGEEAKLVEVWTKHARTHPPDDPLG